MIYFYQSLKPFYAITLDLDNTLYDNYPVISRAEEKLILFLQKYHPALSRLQKKDYYFFRRMLRLIDPNIRHDANFWSWKSIEEMLLQLGLSKRDAQLGADISMGILIYWRNKIDISIHVHKTLDALSSKWPLIAITNGNANPMVFGLKKYFYDILQSGVHGKSKPYTDMYLLSSKYFELSCRYILHVGDNLIDDIQGAKYSGMQSCWINQYYLHGYKDNNISFCSDLFPDIKISKLMSLTCFL